MWLVRKIRDLKFKPSIDDQRQFYEEERSTDQIRAWQLARFNEQWKASSAIVPFYSRLLKEINLPATFTSWDEVYRLFPVTDRKAVQSRRAELINDARPAEFVRITGGSTSEPIHIPAWNSELEFGNKDFWFARSWYGVNPSDKLFMIWGHRHLLGTGINGACNRLSRIAKDALAGYYRFSAYDLSESRLRLAADELLRFRPRYIVAYASALARFAQTNERRMKEFQALRLKVAIATTECFPRDDDRLQIERTLGCPVIMEYGAIETGPIAYQQPDGIFKVFWRHYHLEGRQSEIMPGKFELCVTSLYPRCFPLVRYAIGDLILPNQNLSSCCREFQHVTGRSNDALVLRTGSVIHPQVFRDCISWCHGIADFQVIQEIDGEVHINIVQIGEVSLRDFDEIRRRLREVNKEFSGIRIQRVDQMAKTVAGKTRRIVRLTPNK